MNSCMDFCGKVRLLAHTTQAFGGLFDCQKQKMGVKSKKWEWERGILML